MNFALEGRFASFFFQHSSHSIKSANMLYQPV